jgi:hypothetical protein
MEIAMDRSEALQKMAKLLAQGNARTTGQHVMGRSWLETRRIYATLWLLGASYAQLSMLFGVARPTIRQGMLKELSFSSQRVHLPTGQKSRLSFDVVSWYLDRLREHPDKIVTMTPDDLVSWLLAEHPYQGD